MRNELGGGPGSGVRVNACNDSNVTATGFAPRGLTFFFFSLFAALVAAFAFSGSAHAEADSGTIPPAISSDKADYAPGELVTLNGSNWRAGETVTIDVNDDEGQSWRRTVDVVADVDGKIVDSFNLPDHFVAVYTVTATGLLSGTAVTSFTDGNVKVKSALNRHFNYTVQAFGSSSDCTTGGGPTLTHLGDTNGTGEGSNSGESLLITANTNANTPNGSLVFSNWTNPDGLTIIGALTSRTICVSGFATGSKDLIGNYVGNTAPVAVNDSYAVNEDAVLTVAAPGVLGNDTDANGQPLTAGLVTGPSFGSLTLNANGSFTYTPNANFFGSDSFTYRANDSLANSNTATVSLAVNGINDAPSFTKGADQTVAEDAGAQSVNPWATSISPGPPSESAQTVSFLITANTNAALFSAGPAVSPTGVLTFTPAANANGSATITLTLKDSGGTANGGVDESATQSFVITVTAVDDAPVAVDDSKTVAEDSGATTIDVRANDTDIDGGPKTIQSVTQPANGTVTITNVGADLTYAPNLNYCNGGIPADTFTYTLNGGSTATVSVTVTCVNDAPVAVADSASTAEDTAVAKNVIANDTDVDNTNAQLSVKPGSLTATNGLATLDPDGRTIHFTPAANLNDGNVGPAGFTVTYRATDGALDSNLATLTISVSAVNDPPAVAVDAASVTVNEGQTAVNTGTWSDIDAGDTVTLSASVGTVIKNANGTWSWSLSTSDGPDQTQTVTITATDAGSATAQAQFGLTVNNVAPTVSLTGLASVAEGSTHTYSFTVSDPGADTFVLGASECGTGGSQVGADTFNATTGAGSFDCSFPDGPASPTISVTVSDSDGASDSETLAVSVANVKPSIVLTGAATADEGETKTYSFTVTDPGVDTHTLTTACGANGAKVAGSDTYAVGTGLGSFQCFFADGPATTNVTATVTDSDGASDTDNQVVVVTVSNVAPTVTLSGSNDLSVNEGSSHTYAFTSSDPGEDSFALVSVDCGANGSQVGTAAFNTATGAGSFVCSFPDGPANSTVAVQVKDSDNANSNTATQTVAVANVGPTVTLTGLATVSEGSTHTYSFTVTDPGADTFVLDATDCGTGGSQVGADTFNATSGAGSFDCNFPDGSATPTVRVTVSDSDGAPDSDSLAVTVNNVAPTVTLSFMNVISVDEGSSETYSYSISDPGDDAITSVTTSCSGAAFKITLSETFNGTSGSFACSFTDGPSMSIVSASATDSDGATGAADTQTVTVSNVAPTVSLAAANDLSVDEGSQETYAFSVSDPGADTFSVLSASCGANGSQVGTATTNASGGSFVCSFPDGLANSTVSVQVKDSDEANSNTDSQTVAVANVAPTVTLAAGNDLSVNEGSTHTYSYAISDPGQDTVTSVATFCGANGTKSNALNTNTGGSFDCTFLDGPASSTVSASATDSDGATGNTATQSVTVNNVAPMVTLSLSNDLEVNEGTTHTYSYTVTDPGQDTFSASAMYPKCGVNGTLVGTPATTPSGGSFQCSFSDGPASTTVAIKVQDSDGASDTDSEAVQIVAVANVAPVVTLSAANDLSVAEGSQHTYSFTSSDSGVDEFSLVSVACGASGSQVGAATFNTASGAGSFVCSFADGPANSTVAVQVKDSDNANSNTATQTVAVANVGPTVTLTGLATVSEGSTHTYSFMVSDPGADTFVLGASECGTGGSRVGADTFNATSGAGSFDCNFPDGPASPTVSVTVSDSDGAPDSDTLAVTVANVAPTVTLAAGNDPSVNEGSTHTYSYTISDPGVDGVSAVAVSCSANGTLSDQSNTDTSGSFKCTFTDGPATSTVSAQATDSDNAAGNTATQSVAVANVAPTVSLAAANDLSVDEGSQETYAFSVSDPGADTFSVLSASCGLNGSQVGTATTNASGGSFVCSFPDGLANSTVSVQVKDSDEANSNTDSQTVAVANVAPTVTLAAGNDLSVNEGSTHTYSYAISDPGQDTVTSVATFCGANGTKSNALNTNTGGSFDCTFLDGPASSTVSASATDSDGATGNTATQSVTVNNVAPTATIAGAPATSPEGTAINVTGTFTDPSAVDTHTQAWTVTKNGVAYGSGGSGASFSFTPDDNGDYVVTYTVTDDDGGVGSDSETINVTNVAPTLTTLTQSSYLVLKDTPVSVTGTYSDPATADTFTCVVNWDEPSPATEDVPGGSTSCTGTHTYTVQGTYTVSMKVRDDDGGVSNTLETIITVYDPGSGGFVTGGGWIISPPGSYAAEPTASGKANFGFTSQYKKGSTIPTGETEFQLHFASFNFHSTSYEALVVSGYKAQFRGSGTVNGVGGYKFVLTAYDGQLQGGGAEDKFRMKVTKDGVAVYDTKMGVSDDLDLAAPLAIGGGGIVIHKPK